jgi:hypothetical protein
VGEERAGLLGGGGLGGENVEQKIAVGGVSDQDVHP